VQKTSRGALKRYSQAILSRNVNVTFERGKRHTSETMRLNDGTQATAREVTDKSNKQNFIGLSSTFS
jgi:hypothetical protein